MFFYPILKGFINKYSSQNIKGDVYVTTKYISFLIGLFLGILINKGIFVEQKFQIYRTIYNLIPQEIINYIQGNPIRIYLISAPIIILICYFFVLSILCLINNVITYPILDKIQRNIYKKSDFTQRTIGSVFEIPKAFCYLIIICFLLNTLNLTKEVKGINKYLQDSKLYGYVCENVIVPVTKSSIVKKLPGIINNSVHVVTKEYKGERQNPKEPKVINGERVIVYYNGVTLEDGIKSNEEINNFSKQLCKNMKDDYSKAKLLYKWVGENIEYDDDKARRVLDGDFSLKSGAINTFYTKKGICFDYACLYAAMCRANGLKVRMIMGEGFNGVNWVTHAWNEVYISDKDKWIKVDATFFKGGNYFDSFRFDVDHRESELIGEW